MNVSMNVIETLFLLLGTGLVLITVLKYLRLPTMFGYLLLGILVGPYGLEFFEKTDHLAHVAELGIMALMFTLGLKFSVSKLASYKLYVFGLGGLQVLLTLVVAMMLARWAFDASWNDALLFGSVVSLSSTAVISKILIDRGEVSTPHGIRTVSVLIFQDLAVIPMLIYFSFDPLGNTLSLPRVIITAVIVLGLLIFVAPRVMPKLVDFFAAQKSSEIFTVFALVLVVGLSLLTHAAGLSMVLGSFITGMLLSESRHRYLIEDIIRPFREIFLGFFFLSIGLLIVPDVFRSLLWVIIAVSVAVLIIKPIIIFLISKRMHTHDWTAAKVALALGGTGEFGFVLLTAAAGNANSKLLQILLAVNLVAMVFPTLLLDMAEKIKNKLSKQEWMLQARDLTRAASQVGSIKDHVIICGYGQNGRVITKLLNKHGIKWVAIENNHEIYVAATAAGFNVVYGDSRLPELLITLGIFDAKAMIITHGIQSSTVMTVQAARELRADLPITAKVLGDSQISEVRDAGASYLSISSIETGASMAARALQEFNITSHEINDDVRKLHDDMLKHGGSDLYGHTADEEAGSDAEPRPVVVEINGDSILAGMSVAALKDKLKDHRIELLSLERDGKLVEDMEIEELAPGDQVVISGNKFDLDAATTVLGLG